MPSLQRSETMAKNHLKRLAMPKSWPLPRKETVFISRLRPGSHTASQALPLTTLLTDVLKQANNAREVRFLLRKQKVLVGGKRRQDYQYPVGLFEVVNFTDAKIAFRLVYDKLGKLCTIPVDEKEAQIVPAKILSLKQIRGGKVQYGLFGGRTLLFDKVQKEYKIGDTLLLDAIGKVVQHLSLKKGALVYFIDGKFQGTTAVVDEIMGKDILVHSDKATSKTLTEYAYVVGDKTPALKLV